MSNTNKTALNSPIQGAAILELESIIKDPAKLLHLLESGQISAGTYKTFQAAGATLGATAAAEGLSAAAVTAIDGFTANVGGLTLNTEDGKTVNLGPGVITLDSIPPVAEPATSAEAPVTDAQAEEQAAAFLASLVGSGDGAIAHLDQHKVKSGRTYTAIAKKGASKLLVNLEIEPARVPAPPHPAFAKASHVVVVVAAIRTIESGSTTAAFNSVFPTRDALEGDNGILRGPKIAMPVCLMGPPDYLRGMWTAQKVTEKLVGWLKAKVASVPDATITVSDEVLTMVIEQRLDSICADKFFLFTLPE